MYILLSVSLDTKALLKHRYVKLDKRRRRENRGTYHGILIAISKQT